MTLPAYLPESFTKLNKPWWPDKMAMLTAGAVDCPAIRGIFDKVQDELMPVTVTGDIQWGVNRTKKGWLVWLLNNRGVTHFAGEDEILDPGAASRVTVTEKATGRTETVVVGAGAWRVVEFQK